MARRSAIGATALVLAIVCTACTAGSAGSPGRSPPGAVTAGDAGPGVITVGSFDFPESVLLAHLYAGALSARGYPVRVLLDLGSRELVEPALMTGLVQLVPEYTGSALEFVSLGRAHATADVAATAAALTNAMATRGIVTARPAAAQDANAIVVTAATASRYRLRTISDLARAAPRLVFGGPPECPERPDCLPGLRRTYGVRFRELAALDAVSVRLSTDALTALDAQVELDGHDPRTVARSWLREQGLLRARAS